MEKRIKDKIKQIEEFLEDLLEIRPLTFEDYVNDIKTKSACERYAEKIIEAIIDVSYLIIRHNNLKMPEEEEQAFDVLAESYIISKKLSERLKEAKGMRNFLIHEYGEIDNSIVFRAINEELERDVKEFLNKIKEKLEGGGDENTKDLNNTNYIICIMQKS